LIWFQKAFAKDNPELIQISDFFKITGTVFRDPVGANRRTLSFEVNDKTYFLKLHWGVGWKEIIKNLITFRLPIIGAENEWQAIRKLESIGVETMELMSYGKQGWNPATQKSFVITAALENTISLEDYCVNWKTNPPERKLKRALIKRVAQMTRLLHTHGVNHRDLYICHFLLEEIWSIDNNELHLSLIDLHRVQIRDKTPRRWLVKDLGSLWFSAMEIGLSNSDLLYFIKEYRFSSPAKVLRNEKSFWADVKKRAVALKNKPIREESNS